VSLWGLWRDLIPARPKGRTYQYFADYLGPARDVCSGGIHGTCMEMNLAEWG
jgi:hypothetical protein